MKPTIKHSFDYDKLFKGEKRIEKILPKTEISDRTLATKFNNYFIEKIETIRNTMIPMAPPDYSHEITTNSMIRFIYLL